MRWEKERGPFKGCQSLIKVQLTGKSKTDTVFSAPILSLLFRGEGRKRGGKSLEITVLNGIIELWFELITHPKTSCQEE
jgi:hypothetical protein